MKLWQMLICTLPLLVSCSAPSASWIGPRLPKKEATTFLESSGVSDATIFLVVQLQQMTWEQFQELSKSPSEAVRYLIAKNPFAPTEIYEALRVDSSEFVRQGAAESTSILEQQAVALSRDRSSKVRGSLVTNPSVSTNIIIEIKRNDPTIPLSRYAMNPNCPSTIRNEILNSGDEQAKKWLSQKWAVDATNKTHSRVEGTVPGANQNGG